MKTKVLLVDESLTVQKVVSLTLDKSAYHLTFAKSRTEAMKQIVDNPPQLILVSDQMSDINVATFPKELESWLGGLRDVAPVILISSHDIREQRHYAAVLKKPFTPQALQDLVSRFTKREAPGFGPDASQPDDFEDTRLQKIFNDTFADESSLVRETFQNEGEEGVSAAFTAEQRSQRVLETHSRMVDSGNPFSAPARSPAPVNPAADSSNLWAAPATTSKLQEQAVSALWGEDGSTPVGPDRRDLSAKSNSLGATTMSEQQIEEKLKVSDDLSRSVEKVLERIVPPIVERMVQQRLDELMKEQERYLELKP